MSNVPVLSIFLAVVLKTFVVAMLPRYRIFRVNHRAPAIVFEASLLIFLILPIIGVIALFAFDGMAPETSREIGQLIADQRLAAR